MNHGRKVPKLQRDASHRKALLANLVCSLIEHTRIRTTLAKAKAVRPLAEKMVTLGKAGTLHSRRIALSALRQKEAVKRLFEEVAPRSKDRKGGYTRIIKIGPRLSDAAPMAFIEWVDAPVVKDDDVIEVSTSKKEAKPKEAKAAKAAKEPKAEKEKAAKSESAEKPKRTKKAKTEESGE
jgi:large subunit ribosomal protein L17